MKIRAYEFRTKIHAPPVSPKFARLSKAACSFLRPLRVLRGWLGSRPQLPVGRCRQISDCSGVRAGCQAPWPVSKGFLQPRLFRRHVDQVRNRHSEIARPGTVIDPLGKLSASSSASIWALKRAIPPLLSVVLRGVVEADPRGECARWVSRRPARGRVAVDQRDHEAHFSLGLIRQIRRRVVRPFRAPASTGGLSGPKALR